VRTLKSVIASLLVAALAFLAGFILAINFYSTWQAFARRTASRSDAFWWGFLIAGIAGASAFGLSLYWTLQKKKP
jgi:hypothetical protein